MKQTECEQNTAQMSLTQWDAGSDKTKQDIAGRSACYNRGTCSVQSASYSLSDSADSITSPFSRTLRCESVLPPLRLCWPLQPQFNVNIHTLITDSDLVRHKSHADNTHKAQTRNWRRQKQIHDSQHLETNRYWGCITDSHAYRCTL